MNLISTRNSIRFWRLNRVRIRNVAWLTFEKEMLLTSLNFSNIFRWHGDAKKGRIMWRTVTTTKLLISYKTKTFLFICDEVGVRNLMQISSRKQDPKCQ